MTHFDAAPIVFDETIVELTDLDATEVGSPTMLDGWTDAQSESFQKDILSFRHNLETTGLFSDEALIDLLDRHPSDMLDVCTMGETDNSLYPNKFRTGDFRGVSGADLLAAAKAGSIWINVRNAMNIHDDYNKVLTQMYGDLADATGNKAYSAKGGILISSPIAKVPYHFDKTEVILWHIRGVKTIHLWPATQDFIPDSAVQATLTNMIDDDLPYESHFEDHSTVIKLKPDEGLTWPLNSPHRVDNETFCVSVTTEYSTKESGTKNAVMMANATLRRVFGINTLYENDGAIARRIKSLFGRVIRRTPLARRVQADDMVTFKIDANVPGYIVDVEPFKRDF